MKNTLLKICIFVAIIFSVSFAERQRGPAYNDIRSMGMGNTTVAVTTDRTAIFHNPAGLGLIREDIDISISPLAVAIDGKFITLIKALSANKDKLSNINNIDADFINTINSLDGEWVGIQYLPEITIASHNIGFGVYSVLPIDLRVESGHLIPKLGLSGQQDLVFTWAVGVPLRNENVHCGISVEYLQRTPLSEKITKYAETFKLFDELSSGNFFGILGDYSKVQHGVSFDVGLMHEFSGFRLAYDIKDILGIIGGEMVFPPSIDLGCAYFFPQLRKYSYIENFIIGLEFSNIVGVEPKTGKYEQFWKKTHFGIEFDVKYAALRLGLNQGYPTAGIGIRAGVFRADYVFFQEERGYYVGQWPVKKHLLSLSFNFKVKKKKGTSDDALPPPKNQIEEKNSQSGAQQPQTSVTGNDLKKNPAKPDKKSGSIQVSELSDVK